MQMNTKLNLRKVLLVLSFIGALGQLNAQIAIGTNTPDASAKFQIDATDKGFLPPRVALTSLTDNTTIASPATGLMVYCTGAAGLAEGFYYWNASSWTKMSQVSNVLDMGYVVGWPSNTAPPGYLLPLSGGTYNWADYPEFQSFNATYASQFISSSNATTFTLKNINSSGRFLRGSSTAGVDQAATTAMPVSPFITGSAGSHDHWVDPPLTWTSSNGNHTHGHNATGGQWNPGLAFNDGNFTTGGYDYTWGELNEVYTTALNIHWAGDHAHSLDVPGFSSSINGAHTHTITGGDAETRPINTSVIWVLKVKPTSTSGNLTINNTYTGSASASNGITNSSNNIKLGGTLTEATTINKNGNNLNLSGTGNVVISGDVTATGTIRSAAVGQVLNMAMLPPNATGTVLVNSTSFTNVAQVTYTPVSSNSFILIEYATAYEISGINTDSFQSEINVAGTQITYGFQQYSGTAGGGGRSGSLFPLMGRYTNSSTSTITINVNARRISSDDNFSVYRDGSSWFKITEIAR